MENNELNICIIFSKNYLAFARNLTKNFLHFHPKSKVFALLVDELKDEFDPQKEPFELIKIEELNIKNLKSFTFKYNVTELNTAVKPYFIEYLYNKHPEINKICYFDPDIHFYKTMAELSQLLDKHNFVVTPHTTSPIPEDGCSPSEVDLLLSGSYNLGFIGTRRNEETFKMLKWWQERLYDKAVNRIEKGLFTDQKWMILLDNLFDDVYVLREPGYNVAYWNLHERSNITKINEEYFVNGKPLYFFHFSGFPMNEMELVSKYQTRHHLSRLNPTIKELFEGYKEGTIKNAFEETKKWTYAYGFFENGVKISDIFRALYWDRKDLQKKFENPYKTEHNSFLEWLMQPARKDSVITNLMEYTYNFREDVKRFYPDIWGKDQMNIFHWAYNSFRNEYKFDAYFSKNCTIEPSKKHTRINKHIILAKISELIKKLTGPKGHAWFYRQFLKFQEFKKRRGESKKSKTFLRSIENQKKPFGVNIIGYINAESGVGEGARGIIRAIETSEIPFSLYNIDQAWTRTEDKTYTNFSNQLPYDINILVANADQIPYIIRDIGPEKFTNKYTTSFWAWELTKFPEKWQDRFNYVNEVWTMSTFCLNAISEKSTVPVVNTPIPIEFDVDAKYTRNYFKIPENQFVFLFCFDGLSLIERKNPFAVAKSFSKAFENKNDILLIIKCHNAQPNQLEELKNDLKNCNYKIIPDYMNREEMLGLFNCMDCFVSLHRAEGFGYSIAEAMYLGKHIIATGWSGNLDFTNTTNSHLVNYKMIEIEHNVGPYEKGNLWAEPDIDHAAKTMLNVYTNRDKNIAKKGQEYIKENFSKKTLAERFKSRIYLIKEIMEKAKIK
ncbi:MAG: group 1 glycosyl transferase [Candidatus Peregrinibacteria bacterium GW2011_GWC2_39_14]|nr:MAG: Glycosyl transferase, group 1 [Candidatus Peregrinibacteria bacterium GW2011_GWA2_38_36]KKR07058.1 MAG: group 1 glycosyl transferase [Candidatus Peregrinibacteria bacterium GW2011_GWC2_39_14]